LAYRKTREVFLKTTGRYLASGKAGDRQELLEKNRATTTLLPHEKEFSFMHVSEKQGLGKLLCGMHNDGFPAPCQGRVNILS